MVSKEELEALKISFELIPCTCSAFKDPHHHLGDNTIIPWSELVESLKGLQDVSMGASFGVPGTAKLVKCPGTKVC